MNITTKLKLLSDLRAPEYFGFFAGHYELSPEEMDEVRDVFGKGEAPALVADYERNFASAVGSGEAVSFAAARMAFYTAMKLRGIGPGDEVLLTGFTCSVMANAVWRIGATPVYADIEPSTLGSDPEAIEKSLTPRTRMVVAQHSFGIPCAIGAIAALCRQRGVFLLEDSAISLGSSYQGTNVGEWGDATIFSTDHSKPINTLTGGLLSTRDPALAAKAREFAAGLPALDPAHQQRLWRRLQIERRWFHPRHYALGRLLTKLRAAPAKLRKKFGASAEYVLLEGDFKPRIPVRGYPYPARLPAFLARVGLAELRKWPAERERRCRLLQKYLEISEQAGLSRHLPAAYSDEEREIVPLRFVYTHPRADEIVRRMSRCVDVEWIWFREPIVCAPDGPASFQYASGCCPRAELAGRFMINWPCVVPPDVEDRLLEAFQAAHAGLD